MYRANGLVRFIVIVKDGPADPPQSQFVKEPSWVGGFVSADRMLTFVRDRLSTSIHKGYFVGDRWEAQRNFWGAPRSIKGQF